MIDERPGLEPVFRALSNRTRRAVIESLTRGPAPVSDLAEPFDMALPSFLQHLDVLEECGLVRTVKVGRVRTCWLDPEPLEIARDWMENQKTIWTKRLDQLDAYLVTLDREDQDP